LSLTPAGGNLILSWTVPATNFVVQQNSYLGLGNWTAVTDPPTLNLTNLHQELFLSPSNTQSLFRLKAP
jgi:hypothetical protein